MFQWLHQICTKFLEGNHSVDKRFEEYILCYYKRAIKIVNKYQNAEIKLIDCPLLSIRHWNKNKGHPKPETFKVDDFIITRQIQELNYKISFMVRSQVPAQRYMMIL
jgi:hypothetical protein